MSELAVGENTTSFVLEPLRSALVHRFSSAAKNDVPQAIITIPSVGKFGIISMDPNFWPGFTKCLLIQTMINIAIAIVIYHFITVPAKQKAKEVKHGGNKPPLSSYLVGYGLVIPALLATPFYVMEAFHIENMVFILVLSGSCSGILLFRCLEAMYDTTPRFAVESLSSFVMYYSSPIQFSFDNKTQTVHKASSEKIMTKAKILLSNYIAGIFMFSILIPSSYEPFPSISKDHITKLSDLFYYGNLINNYFMASLVCCFLAVCTLAAGIPIDLISGNNSIQLMNRPMLSSTSPSDFWGNRWNKLIHGALKRGLYIPMRKHNFSRYSAALATFVASGLMHEYILVAMAYKRMQQDPNYTPPNYGNHFYFFAWNGVAIILEYMFKDHPTIRWMSQNLPQPVVTALVILMVLPIGHWFTDEVIAANFCNDLALAFPRIVWLA